MFEDSLRNYEADPNAKNLVSLLIATRRLGLSHKKALFSIDKWGPDSGSIYFYLFEDDKLRIDEYGVIYPPESFGKGAYAMHSDPETAKYITEASHSFGINIPGKYTHFDYRDSRLLRNRSFTFLKRKDPIKYVKERFKSYNFPLRYGNDFLEIPTLDFNCQECGYIEYKNIEEINFPKE